MELHQLRYLVLLADELHFTRAAARGNVAQPALSRQIRKLEDELGIPLVDRTTRRVKLTPAGADLAATARDVLAQLDEARAAATAAVALLSGRLTIGMTRTPGPVDVPRLLGAFNRVHPDVALTLTEELSVELADRLRGDELDLAFVTAIDAAARRSLRLRPLASEDLLAILPQGHHLAQRDALRLADLQGERFIAFPAGATIRAAVEDAARRAGFAPRIAFESNEVERTRALVAEGLGVAVLPRTDAEQPGPAVAAVRLRDRGLVHEVFVAHRDGRRLAPAATALLTLLD
ncbi:HTH-type transcriptional regulator GltC [Baekduia alba]|uniref:LysR family transcriptional regulator n=1 Tax=Baekduia alba TaxID=2997333 RepID=UPI00234249F4|nr:LysR family transcriptional regulator [Baekduia alba]WCB93534.1 HTH-type transcriptional regulator GltC [Baekduia alba]